MMVILQSMALFPMYVCLVSFDVTDFLDTWAPIRSKKILTMMTENENT